MALRSRRPHRPRREGARVRRTRGHRRPRGRCRAGGEEGRARRISPRSSTVPGEDGSSSASTGSPPGSPSVTSRLRGRSPASTRSRCPRWSAADDVARAVSLLQRELPLHCMIESPACARGRLRDRERAGRRRRHARRGRPLLADRRARGRARLGPCPARERGRRGRAPASAAGRVHEHPRSRGSRRLVPPRSCARSARPPGDPPRPAARDRLCLPADTRRGRTGAGDDRTTRPDRVGLGARGRSIRGRRGARRGRQVVEIWEAYGA